MNSIDGGALEKPAILYHLTGKKDPATVPVTTLEHIDADKEYFAPYALNPYVDNWLVDLSKTGPAIRCCLKNKEGKEERKALFAHFASKAPEVPLAGLQRVTPHEQIHQQLSRAKEQVRHLVNVLTTHDSPSRQ
jgi:hypothetical protein